MEQTLAERFAIIGLGKVGTAVGFLMRKAGYRIVAVADLSEEALRQGHPYTGGLMTTSAVEAASLADTIMITTVDDAIGKTCETIARSGIIDSHQKYIYMSGACPLSVLEPARVRGAEIACIHPLQSFAHVSGAIENIPGSVFAITASSPAIESWARNFVSSLGGLPFIISDGDPKTLYHIAACIASNYLTTLLHLAVTIYHKLGLEGEKAITSILPLVKGTLQNIEDRGTIHALTGPIARGDVGTVRQHLHVLSRAMPELLPYYRLLGLATVTLAQKKGEANKGALITIEELLKGVDHEYPN